MEFDPQICSILRKQKAPLNSKELVRLDVTEFMTLRLRCTLGKVERVRVRSFWLVTFSA